MGILESFILGTLSYLAYRKVIEPRMKLRHEYRRRLKELEDEQ